MSIRKLLIALIVFAALLGIYFADSHLKELKRLKQEREESLFSFKRDDINALRLTNQHGEFRLTKKDNTWHIEQPIAARADQDAIFTMLSNLSGAKKRNMFDADDSSQYGLSKPRAKITLSASGKSETLLIGEASTYAGQVFAALEGEKKVFTLSDYVGNNLEKTLTDLRDKIIARCAPDAMASFTLTNSKGTIQCVKTGDEWQIEKPTEYRSDRVAVENLLREIDNSRAVDFVDTATVSTPLTPYGLDKPQIRLLLARTKADDVTKTTDTTLLIGSSPDGNRYFARRSGEALIFLIPADLYNQLNTNVAALRDKNLFHTNMLDIGRLEIHAGESTVALIKNEKGEWQFEDEPSARVDQSEVNLTLSNALAFKAKEWITDEPRLPAHYGLEPPKIRFTVQKKDTSASEGIAIGNKPEDKDFIYVQRLGEKTIWGMDWTLTHNLFKTRQDFIDKTLLPIETEKIARLEITDEGAKLSLLRKDEQWFVKKSPGEKQRAVENVAVQSLLSALTSIKYEKEIELSANEREEIQLSNPSYRFLVYDSNDTPVGELDCTSPIRNFVYAQTAAKKIYRLRAAHFAAIEAALKSLREKIEEQ